MRTLPSALAAMLFAGAAAAQQGGPAPAVVVAPAETVDLRQNFVFTGRVSAVQKVEMRARVTGTLEETGFVEGQFVEQGDLLFKIEDDAYAAAVAEIEGSIRSAEANLRLAEIERDRQATLVERNTVAQAELDRAEAELGRVEGELMRLRAQRDRAALDLSYAVIAAPFGGVVGLSSYDVGAWIGPDSGSLVSLTRLDPISVEFQVATAELLEHRQRVERGEATNEAAVRLGLPDGRTYPIDGDIDFVDADVDAGTDTVTLRAVFQNPDGVLLDDALVRVTLIQTREQLVLTVPQQAIQRDQQGAFVLVVGEDSVAQVRRVEVSRVSEGRAAIASGLDEGERVVTEGVNKVRPGAPVDAATASEG